MQARARYDFTGAPKFSVKNATVRLQATIAGRFC